MIQVIKVIRMQAVHHYINTGSPQWCLHQDSRHHWSPKVYCIEYYWRWGFVVVNTHHTFPCTQTRVTKTSTFTRDGSERTPHTVHCHYIINKPNCIKSCRKFVCFKIYHVYLSIYHTHSSNTHHMAETLERTVQLGTYCTRWKDRFTSLQNRKLWQTKRSLEFLFLI